MRISPISSMPVSYNSNKKVNNRNQVSFGRIESENTEDIIEKYNIPRSDKRSQEALGFLIRTDLVTLKKGLPRKYYPYISANQDAINAHPKKDRINFVLNEYNDREMFLAIDVDEKLSAQDPGFVTKVGTYGVMRNFSEDLQKAISEEEDPQYNIVLESKPLIIPGLEKGDTGILEQERKAREEWAMYHLL